MALVDTFEVLSAWEPFIGRMGDWETLVQGITPKQSGCGPLYEMASPLPNRTHESFAIADMRSLKITEPHYHTGGETEFYLVISGLAQMVVGGEVSQIERGSVVVIPPETGHFVAPYENLVLAVINTPPYKPENEIALTASNPAVNYDHQQYLELSQGDSAAA